MIFQLLCWLKALPGHCWQRISGNSYPGARAIIFMVMLICGLIAIHRPNLPHLLPGYTRFDDVMPFTYWGWAGVILALLMLFVKPGSLGALAVNFWISVYLISAGLAFMAGVGVTFSASVFLVLGGAAIILFGADFQGWFPKIGWVQRLGDHPPAFIRRWFNDQR